MIDTKYEGILYRIHTKSTCEKYNIWVSEFIRENECATCKRLFNHVRKSPIDVYLSKIPDKSAVNAIVAPRVGIARRDFLSLFEDEVRRYLKVGRVFGPHGKLYEEFVTYTSATQLRIRGGKNSQYQGVCPSCGNIRYWAGYPWYVLRRDYFEQPLYEATSMGLVVDENLLFRIDRKLWKGIYITKIPIVDEPKDGIDLPNNQLDGKYGQDSA
jgi:hypothetical protein